MNLNIQYLFDSHHCVHELRCVTDRDKWQHSIPIHQVVVNVASNIAKHVGQIWLGTLHHIVRNTSDPQRYRIHLKAKIVRQRQNYWHKSKLALYTLSRQDGQDRYNTCSVHVLLHSKFGSFPKMDLERFSDPHLHYCTLWQPRLVPRMFFLALAMVAKILWIYSMDKEPSIWNTATCMVSTFWNKISQPFCPFYRNRIHAFILDARMVLEWPEWFQGGSVNVVMLPIRNRSLETRQFTTDRSALRL